MLPLSLEEKVLLSLAKDSTFSVHRSTGLGKDPKETPHRGITAARIGGCEGGIVRGWEGDVAVKRKEWEIRKEREAGEEEIVWEGMGRVVGEDEESESEGEGVEGMEEDVVVTVVDDAVKASEVEEEDESSEEEEDRVVVKKQKGKKAGKPAAASVKKARR